jgi:enoyl-CoA hydratase/carnithine racemase
MSPMAMAVIAQSEAGVATLTLNRPERRNAITPELVEELLAALAAAQADDAVRVTRRALEDVRGAVAARDRPFGDYGQGPGTV